MTTKAEILKAIREKCLVDCCCSSVKEVSTCSITDCPLHPFRLGKDPKPCRSGRNLKTATTEREFPQNEGELIPKHGRCGGGGGT